MHCGQASETMSARLDGRLDGTEAAALEKHLASCNACQTEWARMQAVHQLLVAAPMAQAPVRVRVYVMTRLSRRDRARRAIIGGTALSLGSIAVGAIILAPLMLGVLRVTGVAPALAAGGPTTLSHILGAWETMGRTLGLLARQFAVPLISLSLCMLAGALMVNCLWIGAVRQLRASR